jgi:thiol:disulfide interchange protein DsbC
MNRSVQANWPKSRHANTERVPPSLRAHAQLALAGLLGLLAASTTIAASHAATQEPPAAARIRAALHEKVPELNIEQIRVGPIPGLYEVFTGSEIIYSDDAGSRLVLGRVVDTKSRADLTAKRWNELNAVDFDTLPLDLAIKSVRGDGSRKLAIFSDPLCPYCRQLEEQLKDVTNVTIYTFLFPIESLHPGATEKARQIWCTQDRAAVWSAWMLANVEPPAPGACDSGPLQTLQELGTKLRISSTPTLFLADGNRQRGTMPRDKLEQLLTAAAVPQSSPGTGSP